MNRRRFQATLVCAAVSVTTALAADEPTLCTHDEKTLFSCKTGKKVASVCATPDLSSNSGQLTYRFGLPNKEPELTYPTKPILVGEAFSYAYCCPGYAKGSIQDLAFSIEDFTYTVHVEKHAFNDDSSGVIVERNSIRLAYLKCNNAFQVEDLYSLHNMNLRQGETKDVGVSP